MDREDDRRAAEAAANYRWSDRPAPMAFRPKRLQPQRKCKHRLSVTLSDKMKRSLGLPIIAFGRPHSDALIPRIEVHLVENHFKPSGIGGRSSSGGTQHRQCGIRSYRKATLFQESREFPRGSATLRGGKPSTTRHGFRSLVEVLIEGCAVGSGSHQTKYIWFGRMVRSLECRDGVFEVDG